MANQSTTFRLALENFKLGLSDKEKRQFAATTLDDLHVEIEKIQRQQQAGRRLRDMARLELFLEGMKEYDKIVSVFLNTGPILAFVWGPMKFLLQLRYAVHNNAFGARMASLKVLTLAKTACTFYEAFDALLDVYQRIGEQIPLLTQYEDYFRNHPQMIRVLQLIYEDILKFHSKAMKYFQKRMWQQFFQALWKRFDTEFADILRNLHEHTVLIESQATIAQFSEILATRKLVELQFDREREDETRRRRMVVHQWLAAANCGADQEAYSKVRREHIGTGEWLLQENRFCSWFNPTLCSTHLLWMNGIPGAGKSILASLVIEEAQKLHDVHTAFFYCRYLDSARNTFLAVACGILSQLLFKDDALLTYLYEKVSTSGQVTLSLEKTARELLQTSLKAFEKLYIVIDGLDECEGDQRQQMVSFFKETWELLPSTAEDSLRCMFISQDDSIARKDFAGMTSMKIREEHTRKDIVQFVAARSMVIKKKFDLTPDRQQWIQDHVAKSADGMFLFAHLMTSYLINLSSRAELDKELLPENFPQGGTRLEAIYTRIVQRLSKGRGSPSENTLQLLAWLVCAKRPLLWREIQCAVSINLRDQTVNWERNRFRVDSKDLCGSLVDVQTDGTVVLVHHSAKRYLIDKNLVSLGSGEGTLALLCISYLCFEGFDVEDDSLNVSRYIPSGYYGFVDYAYAYWARHLDAFLRIQESKDTTNAISEAAEVFIDMYWTQPTTTTTPPKSLLARWQALSSNRNFDKLVVAGHLAQRQLLTSTAHSPDVQVLQLHDALIKVRDRLESAISSAQRNGRLESMYGGDIFKCPRANCIRFYSGFLSRQERDNHIMKHERSFFCSFSGCHMAMLGCSTLKELHKHETEYHGTFDYDDDEEYPELPPKKVSFDCKKCDAKFTRKHNLQIHMRSRHAESGSKPAFVCAICSKSFARKGDRTRHETTEHNDAKTFVCKGELNDGSHWGCGRVFKRGDMLSRHWKSAKGQKCLAQKQNEEDADNASPSGSVQPSVASPTPT